MTMEGFVTIDDIIKLFRPLSDDEMMKAEALIPIVSDSIRQEARNIGKDIDQMLGSGALLKSVLISVVVDVIGRALMTSTKNEPMTQMSESALGYSVSGTFLVPGGGLFIKRSELARLGLRRQRYGVIDPYGNDQGD